MNKFEDQRINDYFTDVKCYKSVSERPDPQDKMVRAFIIDKQSLDAIKQKPDAILKLKTGKIVKLEIGNFITSNGKVLSKEVFEKHYKPASELITKFLREKISLADSMPDIIERFHGKKQKQTIQKPRS